MKLEINKKKQRWIPYYITTQITLPESLASISLKLKPFSFLTLKECPCCGAAPSSISQSITLIGHSTSLTSPNPTGHLTLSCKNCGKDLAMSFFPDNDRLYFYNGIFSRSELAAYNTYLENQNSKTPTAISEILDRSKAWLDKHEEYDDDDDDDEIKECTGRRKDMRKDMDDST